MHHNRLTRTISWLLISLMALGTLAACFLPDRFIKRISIIFFCSHFLFSQGIQHQHLLTRQSA
ncbi:MAG: hypothetical protein IJC15_00610, partial [Clostridia bacterium]|nr:hypothetical protein [Clostridia bacterium]